MRSRTLFVAVCLWGFAGLLLAQESAEILWTAEYTPESPLEQIQAIDMAMDDSGNVVVLGALRDDEWEADVLLLKYSPGGNLVWSASYDTPGHGDDDPVGLALDSLGNVYVAATSEAADDMTNILVLKFSYRGVLLWARQFDGPRHKDDDASAVALYPDGGVIVVGSSMVSGFYPDLVVLRFSAEGTLMWSRYLDGPGHQVDEAEDVRIDREGNVLVAGTTWSGGSGNDIVVAKFSPDGRRVWSTVYDSPGHEDDVAVAASVCPDGGLVVTGVTGGSDDEGDVVTLCVDVDGGLNWVRQYRSAGDHQDQPAGVGVDSAGNVFVAGTAGSALYDVNGNFLAIKYDTSGALQWAETHDFYGDWDRVASLALDSAGCAYLTGPATGQSGRTVYGTLKYTPDGQLAWEATFQSASGDASPAKIALGRQRCFFVTGTVAESKMRTKILTVKYRQIGTTVPVELVGLSARTTSGGVWLVWQTKSESRNYGFEIQRRRKGDSTWATVGFVRGNGTTEETHQYSFFDDSVNGPGLYSYRLKQIDFSGDWNTSPAVSVLVTLPESADLLTVTPNPFNDETVLRYRVAASGHVELAIFDLHGREVAQLVHGTKAAGMYRAVWNAAGYPTGVYFARLWTKARTAVVKLLLLR